MEKNPAKNIKPDSNQEKTPYKVLLISAIASAAVAIILKGRTKNSYPEYDIGLAKGLGGLAKKAIEDIPVTESEAQQLLQNINPDSPNFFGKNRRILERLIVRLREKLEAIEAKSK